tara:strand:- start:1027 stop:1260 length:234 start_codon:yes stop_codon:yes gene_type:complete
MVSSERTTEAIYKRFEDFTIDLCENEKVDILMVAGIMMAQALRIYKTTMSQEEYDLITDAILKSRDRIQELKPPAMH